MGIGQGYNTTKGEKIMGNMKRCLLVLSLLSMGMSNSIESRSQQFREHAIAEINSHLVKHSDCVLGDLIETIEHMSIKSFNGDNHTAAYVWQGTVYLNKNFKWNNKTVMITLIHEAFHINGICGDDNIELKHPICYAFNKPVYYSPQLTSHIENHLKQYK